MSHSQVYKRPNEGSATGRVWEIADEMTQREGRLPTGREVADRFVAEGGNRNTALTQYSHWKKSQQAEHEQATAPELAETKLTIGQDGRVVIPAEYRRAMRLGPDGHVTARMVDGELRLISPATALVKAQEMVRALVPGGRSLADELIADRRAEVRREAGER